MSQVKGWTALPLAGDGRSLVEASAGTGKTWTIAVLYLRLLLEQQLSPRQIIVSTFTNAAAAELSERLRDKLLWALAEADKHRRGIASDEEKHPDCRWIRGRWRNAETPVDTDVRRLQAALAEFDAAPISTLHSLCSRILADHPFAAGALFRGREMVDDQCLRTALADDLWRVVAQGREDEEQDEQRQLMTFARDARIERKHLIKYMPLLLQENVWVGGLDHDLFRKRFDFLGDVDSWVAKVERIDQDDSLFNKTCTLRKAWLDVAVALESSQGNLKKAVSRVGTLSEAEKMTGVSAQGKKNPDILTLVAQSPDISHALSQCSEIDVDLSESVALRQFLAEAQRWCLKSMQARLDAANQSTFDQLLLSVRSALKPADGNRPLADALFAAWPAALVDEFQDTDPVQFAILDEIYRNKAHEPRGRLVMIGDPKQAIYRFRGGDVQAYERAKKSVSEQDRLTLATNHRSSRGYVEAINQFYAVAGERLGPADSPTGIRYEDVEASARRDSTALRPVKGDTPIERPLVLHELAADDEAADAKAAHLESHALRVCAGQIVRALSVEGYRIGERRLEPGDIAVLLPSHGQIAKLSGLLKARGVPCVVSSQKSVFESGTARELRLLLHAALHADDAKAQRAALATRLCGVSLGELQALRHDSVASERHSVRFHELRKALEQRGPLAVVAMLLDEHAKRWMQSAEGERMLTDLRHLGELLQEAWVEWGGGERLAAWFARQMGEGGADADAAEARALRLESDAARVKLMTLHASKGLEFGVVFLPLMWKHKRSVKSAQGAHLLSSGDGSAKYLVEGPAKDLVKQQEHEERFRMLYVALTRAIHACHVFVLPNGGDAKDVPLNTLDLAKLKAQVAGGKGRIAVEQGWNAHTELEWKPEAASSSEREARKLPPAPSGPLPMRHSFSGLTGGGRQRVAEEGGAAEDEVLVEETLQQAAEQLPEEAAGTSRIASVNETPATDFHPDLDALSALAGADFGNAVHALFEHRSPGQEVTPESVLAALREHGVRPREKTLAELASPLAARLNVVLETPLGGEGGPRLFDLGAADMRAEMEFNYVLDGVSLRALRKACEQQGEPSLVPRREQTLAGLMNGKIDLLFAHGGRIHVLDYKGNQLATGTRACLQDYAPAALEAKMVSTGYRFQALLYTVAVERYLRERLGNDYMRSEHLGDCWYLFIRAVGLNSPAGTPCGVWRHRFGEELLDAVQDVLSTTQQQEAA